MNLSEALDYVDRIHGVEPQDQIIMPHPHTMTEAEFLAELKQDAEEYRRMKRRQRRAKLKKAA